MSAAKQMRNAAIWGTGVLDRNRDQLLGELGKGYEGAKGYLEQGNALYQPYADRYQKGANLYADSLGLNGAEGNARALSAFQRGPGYSFQMQQGLDALNRRRAAGGMLNSGNADVDALQFGQGLANREYGNWQNQLNSYDARGLQTTGQQAMGLNNLGGLTNDYYQSRAGVIDDANKGILDLGTQAFKATAQQKQQQQNNWLGAANSVIGLVGRFAGGGGFGNFFGGGGTIMDPLTRQNVRV